MMVHGDRTFSTTRWAHHTFPLHLMPHVPPTRTQNSTSTITTSKTQACNIPALYTFLLIRSETGAKATAVQNLVKSLKSAGTPIDGVGLQCHFIVGQIPSSFQSTLQAFTALGVEVALTELDIRMSLPATASSYNQQKSDYETVIKACNAVSGCIGVTLWDFTDKFSWVPGTFSGQGAACPWDSVCHCPMQMPVGIAHVYFLRTLSRSLLTMVLLPDSDRLLVLDKTIFIVWYKTNFYVGLKFNKVIFRHILDF
jgi:hypothetical protein